jgi:hypothetical protein
VCRVDAAVHEDRSNGGLPDVPVRLDGTELVVGTGHVGANIALEESSTNSLVECRIAIEEEGVNIDVEGVPRRLRTMLLAIISRRMTKREMTSAGYLQLSASSGAGSAIEEA